MNKFECITQTYKYKQKTFEKKNLENFQKLSSKIKFSKKKTWLKLLQQEKQVYFLKRKRRFFIIFFILLILNVDYDSNVHEINKKHNAFFYVKNLKFNIYFCIIFYMKNLMN